MDETKFKHSATPRRRYPSSRRAERGQSLVEFVLSAPLLLLILLGLVELGSGLNTHLTIIAASRDGARLGAQGGATDAAIRNLVSAETARLQGGVPTACNGDDAGICIDHSDLSSAAHVKVRVCYDHPFIIGIPGMGESLKVCSTTSMRVVS